MLIGNGQRNTDTYQCAEDLLQSSQVLVHFNSSKPIILSCHWMTKDPILFCVCRQLQTGWILDDPPDMKPYHQCQNELSVVDGCLLLGSRVIIPKEEREKVLKQLHIVFAG
uniref:Uncharacterized protein n=1 Tax=Amphimedon queenslandica TaxID=400682 RepID=A0A1X7T4A2_AMPQE